MIILRALKNVEQPLTRTEQLLEENYKVLLTGLLSCGTRSSVLARKDVSDKRNDEAQAHDQAQKYLKWILLILPERGW